MKYIIICAAISSFMLTPISNAHAISSARYYSGYYYYGYDWSPRWGVKGNVMTIWSERPMDEICAEWTNVMLDYSPMYWIQCGYLQWWFWGIIPVMSFYIEKNDALGHLTILLGPLSPLEGHTYSYAIWYDTANDRWRYAILEGSTWIYANWVDVYPDQPVDLQAFVETSHTGTNIDESHFSKLNYWDPGISWWPFWNRHYPKVDDPPYSLYQSSHYEFYASGGG